MNKAAMLIKSFLFCFFLIVYSYAQLSGIYSIGTGGDFESIHDAVDSLKAAGVSGPVTLTILPGVYTEQVELANIAGVNETNVLTIRGSGLDPEAVRVQYSAPRDSNYIFRLHNMEYVRFRNFTIKGLHTRYAGGIDLLGACANIRFDSMHFHGSLEDYNAYESNSGIHASEGHHQYIYIADCAFDSLAFGIVFQMESNNYISYLDIRRNVFQAIGYCPILASFGGTTVVYQNEINSGSYGLRLIQLNHIKIRRNFIKAGHGGIYLSNILSSPEIHSMIANNILEVGPGAAQQGINISSCNYVDLVHNTLRFGKLVYHMQDAGISLRYSYGCNLLNNIVLNYQLGYALYVQNDTEFTHSDYNNFFSFAPVFAYWHQPVLNMDSLRHVSHMDEHSTSVYFDFNPDTVGLPVTAYMDNAGLHHDSVLTDYYGKPRDPHHPDIGAVEYNAPPETVPPISSDVWVGPGGDYLTIKEAATDLFLRGISDSIHVFINPGTYEEQVEWLRVPGNDKEHPLTLESATGDSDDVVIQYNANADSNYIFRLKSLPFFSIKHVTFQPLDDLHSRSSLQIEGHFSKLEFTGNQFLGRDFNQSTAGESHMRFLNYYTDTLLIRDNLFYGGSTTFYLNQSNPVINPDKISITDNSFAGQCYEISLVREVNSLEFSRNTLENGVQGLSVSNIARNVHLESNSLNVQYGKAFNLLYVKAKSTNPSKIFNNFINHTGSSVNNNLVYLNSCDTLRFVNNNLKCNSSNITRNIFSLSGGTDIQVLNSIFYNTGSAYAFYATSTTPFTRFDHNSFYTAGTNLAYCGQDCADLAELQQVSGDNAHSVEANPGYISDSDLHVNSAILNEGATPVSFVEKDIDGDFRHPDYPDIGADEFSLTPNTPPYVGRHIDDLENDEDTAPWVADGSISSVFEDDDNGDFLRYTITSSVPQIRGEIIGDELIVTADTNYHGTSWMAVTATDLHNATARDTFNITILPIPDRPIAHPDSFAVMAGSSHVFPVLVNDTDPDSGVVHIYSVSMPVHGQVDWQTGQDSISYQAEPGYEGPVTFNYSIYNASGLRDTTTVYITVSDFMVLIDSLPGVSNSVVRWIDIDNDKDLDIVMAGATDNTFSGFVLQIYENRDGKFVAGQQLPGIRPSNPNGLVVLDIDNDMDMDFVVSGLLNGGTTPICRLYLNNGLGLFQVVSSNLPSLDRVSITPVDFDQDGDWDLFFQGDSSSNASHLVAKLYRNDGQTQNGTFQFVDITPENIPDLAGPTAAWADYDKDGDPDVAICGAMTEIDFVFDIYKNDNGVLTPLNLSVPQIAYASLQWADVDSDSDLDLIFSGNVEERPVTRRSGLLLNTGNDQFDLQDEPVSPLGFGDLDCVDFDNDGDLDIAIMGRDSLFARHTMLYTNENGVFTEAAVQLPGLSNGSINWADFDKDNDADLLISGIDPQGKRHTYLYQNIIHIENQKPDYPHQQYIFYSHTQVGISWSRAADDHSRGAVNTYNVSVSDEEGLQNVKSMGSHQDDGTLKYGGVGNVMADTSYFLKNAISGKMYFFRLQSIDGAGIPSALSPLMPVTAYNDYFMESYCKLPGLHYLSLSPCDIDRNGFFDLALSGVDDHFNYQTTVYHKGIDFFVPDLSVSLPSIQYPDILWQDFNGDGAPDIFLSGFDVTGENSYLTRLYMNNNNHYELFADDFTGVFKGDAAWGDFDNDGDPDLLIQGATGTVPFTKLYINQDTAFVDSGQEFEGLWWGSVEWGDVDNDGDLDILMCGNSYTPPTYHKTELYLNHNGHFAPSGIDLPDVRMGQARFADTDNDGDLDIFITGESFTGNSWQPITVLLENNNMEFSSTADEFIPLQDSKAVIADFDNDGDLDIAYTGTGGIGNPDVYNSYFYVNNNEHFDLINAYLGGYYLEDLSAADFNGDSKVDIIGGGLQSVFDSDINLFINRTTNDNESPGAPSNLSVIQTDSSYIFSWNASSDDHTPTAALTYNLRIGSQPGQADIKPCNSTAEGYHFIPTLGNVGHRTTWELKNPPQTGSIYWTVQAIDQAFAGSEFAPEHQIVLTGITESESLLPKAYALYQNHPNPFNPVTSIQFDLPERKHTTLIVYNMIGQRVLTVVNSVLPAGRHTIQFEADNLPSGIYFYRLEAGDFIQTKKMLLIK